MRVDDITASLEEARDFLVLQPPRSQLPRQDCRHESSHGNAGRRRSEPSPELRSMMSRAERAVLLPHVARCGLPGYADHRFSSSSAPSPGRSIRSLLALVAHGNPGKDRIGPVAHPFQMVHLMIDTKLLNRISEFAEKRRCHASIRSPACLWPPREPDATWRWRHDPRGPDRRTRSCRRDWLSRSSAREGAPIAIATSAPLRWDLVQLVAYRRVRVPMMLHLPLCHCAR